MDYYERRQSEPDGVCPDCDQWSYRYKAEDECPYCAGEGTTPSSDWRNGK